MFPCSFPIETPIKKTKNTAGASLELAERWAKEVWMGGGWESRVAP